METRQSDSSGGLGPKVTSVESILKIPEAQARSGMAGRPAKYSLQVHTKVWLTNPERVLNPAQNPIQDLAIVFRGEGRIFSGRSSCSHEMSGGYSR